MRTKKYFSVVAAVLIALLLPQTILAEVNNDATYTIATNEIKNWPQGPDVYSDTAVLMEVDTGEILYNKGMDETRYPASITKIMTTLLALENSDMDQEVIFTATGLEHIWEGTNLQMQEGEVLTMEQCLYAIMIKSANEVADQVAETVGKTRTEFIAMMNQKAADLGCKNTHFNNPSGLPDPQHWTTAYDMALIFGEALKNEEFCKIISTLEYTIPATNLTDTPRVLGSHHALLVPTAPEYYEGCLGGKTGVTDEAGNTLVTGVKKNDTTYIAVVMRADSGQVCADSRALFDYGYNSFEKLTVKGKEIIVPKGIKEADLKWEEEKADTETVFNYYYSDYLLDSFSLSAEEVQKLAADDSQETEDITENEAQLEDQDSDEQSQVNEDSSEEISEGLKKKYQTIIIVLGGLILLSAVLIIISVYMNRKKRRKRRR